MTRFGQDISNLSRRSVLKTASTLPLIGAGITGGSQTVAATEGSTIVIDQGGKRIPVTPLSYNNRSIEEFYQYSTSSDSANTPPGLEKGDTSRLFLYEGPRGLSLVTLHDSPASSTGGAASLAFDGLSGGTTSEPIFTDDFSDGLGAWSTRTTSNASVSIDNGRLRHRVYKCNTAESTHDLGEQTGTLEVSFSWESTADNWYEIPDFHLEDDAGNAIDYEVINGRDVRPPGRAGRKSDSVTLQADVDGPVTLRFVLRPSGYCDFFDHADTYFWVDNVNVRPATKGSQWVVTDDASDFETGFDSAPNWSWDGGETAGGALRGGLGGMASPITISPSFRSGIDSWEVLSGDPRDPTVTELDLNQSITISTGQNLQSLADEKLTLADRIDENALGYISDRSQVSPVLARLTEKTSTGELSGPTAADSINRLSYGEQVTDTVLAGAGPGTSPQLQGDKNISQLTAQSAVNPILDILFAGLSLVKAARRLPFVRGTATRAANYLADLAADIAGTFSRSLERLIRRQGADAGFAILNEAESRTSAAGQPIVEDEFADTRAAEGAILIEDSSDVIFRDFLFSNEYDFQGADTEPLDRSLSEFVEEVDPDPDPGIDGSGSDAQTVSEDGIDAVNNIYTTVEDTIGDLDSILVVVGALESILAVVAFIAGLTGALSAAGVVAGAAAALLGLGVGSSIQIIKWGVGANGILGARYRHQQTLPLVRSPSGGI